LDIRVLKMNKKSNLGRNVKSLGKALQTYGQHFMFDNNAASKLVEQYFPGGVLWWQGPN
jgi:hypothetical protein